jgi:hypothetical protein
MGSRASVFRMSISSVPWTRLPVFDSLDFAALPCALDFADSDKSGSLLLIIKRKRPFL